MFKIERIPDATQFDPFKLTYWTLPMTLAWIIWRTPDAVRSQWELYDFHLRDLNRAEDGSRPRSQLRSLYDLLLSTLDDGVDQSAVLVKGPPARDDLWSKLGSAKLTATGTGVQFAKREPIACTEWQDLDSFDPGVDWPFDAIGKGSKHELRFKNVSVPTKDVLELWPISDNSAVGSKAESRPAAEMKSRGRKPGQGSYEPLDRPLLLEMGQLLLERKADSPEEAARQVADRAHGSGTPESKAERLARRYRGDRAKRAQSK